MITSIKVFKEVFKPYNLAGRQQELMEQTIKMLGQEILKGDLKVEPWMIDLDPSRVKVRKIVGNLECGELGLTSLPAWFQLIEEVTGLFWCDNNKLTSLEGGPETVGGSFRCGNNQLTSLEGSPQTVGWSFDCSDNKLTSLEGSPQTVGGSFDCRNNQLTSLEGGPQTIGWSFYCNKNKLTSLEGGPQTVRGSFDFSNNQLTSLQGLPKEIGVNLWCYNNAKQFSESDIPSDTKIDGKIEFN